MPRDNKNNLRELLNKSMLVNVLLGAVIVIMGLLLFYQSVLHAPTSATTTSSTTIAATTTTISNSSSGTLAGIDIPLNSTQLSVINNAPLSYYEIAGQRLLNGSLKNEVINQASPQYNALIINGKPTVIYMGAITCIFCGENRWAMALALARFGNFTQLFNGYSALGDGDVPTLYWTADNITATSSMRYGNYYNSNYINFISAEYESPITQGFTLPSTGGTFYVQYSPNATYTTALSFMNKTGKFQGTPFTFWGHHL